MSRVLEGSFHPLSIEITVISTQNNLDQVAERIERAYRRRHSTWLATGLTPGVWTAAAVRLNDVSHNRVVLPIDPELFVAVQNYKSFRRDPWRELTQEGSVKTYRFAVRKIISQLKIELAAEMRWSKRFLEAGGSLDEVMAISKSRVSPITKLVLCHRQQRQDLAETIRPAAEAQHLACPLYQFAYRNLMPSLSYPDSNRGSMTIPGVGEQKHSFAWN